MVSVIYPKCIQSFASISVQVYTPCIFVRFYWFKKVFLVILGRILLKMAAGVGAVVLIKDTEHLALFYLYTITSIVIFGRIWIKTAAAVA